LKEGFYCIDFAHGIVKGQSWTVTIVPLTSGSPTALLESAWLVNQMSKDPNQTDQAAYQWAIWSLTGAKDIYFTGSWSGAALLGDAAAAVTGGYSGAGWEALVPESDSGQEFLVPVPKAPEPSTFFLLGLGVVGILGRKLKKS
jgi:hypothetical protein